MKMARIMLLKTALLAISLLFFCPLTNASENEALPMDLMELLGELGDDEDTLDQETLEAAMRNVGRPHDVNSPQQNTDVGVHK
jgi:hypothetical protein